MSYDTLQEFRLMSSFDDQITNESVNRLQKWFWTSDLYSLQHVINLPYDCMFCPYCSNKSDHVFGLQYEHRIEPTTLGHFLFQKSTMTTINITSSILLRTTHIGNEYYQQL